MILDDHRAFSTSYESGYVATVTVDAAKFETECECPYHHIELINYSSETVQSSTETSVQVTDETCIWDGDDGMGVGFILFGLVDGSPEQKYYVRDFGPEYYAPVTATAVPGVISTRVQFSDGRIETIQTPVAYEVGAVVTVVHKKDGSCVVGLAQ